MTIRVPSGLPCRRTAVTVWSSSRTSYTERAFGSCHIFSMSIMQSVALHPMARHRCDSAGGIPFPKNRAIFAEWSLRSLRPTQDAIPKATNSRDSAGSHGYSRDQAGGRATTLARRSEINNPSCRYSPKQHGHFLNGQCFLPELLRSLPEKLRGLHGEVPFMPGLLTAQWPWRS